jgi:formate hydrogenlyase subunit 3/multisubunit Na+/H+ antiporter MnhD subunit
MSDQIVRADPVRRRRFLWALAGLAALGAAGIWLLSARLARGGLALAEARRLLWLVVALLTLVAAGAALSLARLATRVFRSGRYPPPGAFVLRDRPVRTGSSARALAWLGLTCAALLLTAAVALPLFLLRLLRLLGASG